MLALDDYVVIGIQKVVSTAQVVQAAILAGVLLFVGWLLYHEAMTWNKIIGIVICLIGLVFINLKT